MNLNLFFTPTDILLPAHADMRRWSVIACDQFTADAGYWQAGASPRAKSERLKTS